MELNDLNFWMQLLNIVLDNGVKKGENPCSRKCLKRCIFSISHAIASLQLIASDIQIKASAKRINANTSVFL